ncbi:MAG: DUF2807 domain-containing protein [Dehalococcoidales bacterium]|nr:MAG: DUF2807 domain-containing protein [Dehalococcoidales bacterium]
MDIDELRREAEEGKERLKRDIFEFRDILRRMAEEVKETRGNRAEASICRAEKRIEEMVQQVESRIDKAILVMVGSSSGKRKMIAREMDFSDFTNIEVSSCFKVSITRADSYSVNVAANEKLFDCINVSKSGSTLKMSIKPLPLPARPNLLSPRPDLRAEITMPELHKLRLGSAATCIVSGFNSNDGLDLNVTGNSALDIDIEAGKTKVEISGASRLRGKMKLADTEFTLSGASRAELNGSAKNVVLNAWGASRLDLADFVLNDTGVNLKGASEATIKVNGRMDLDLSGGSRLYYNGSPTMGKINVSGTSTLGQR